MSRTLAILNGLPLDGHCITTAALADATGIDRRTIAVRMPRLKARGWAASDHAGCYRLTDKGRALRDAGCTDLQTAPRGPRRGPPAAPRKRGMQDKVWWHLRASRRLSTSELAELAGAAPRSAALRDFLRALYQAGYLEVSRRRIGTAKGSNGAIRWHLVRDSGPLAPVVQDARARVFDRNARAYHALDRARSPRAASPQARP